MTVANLFAKHRAGEISREKFLYEVRRDSQLPYINNLTSYEDAVKILKNRGVIKESEEHSDEVKPGQRYKFTSGDATLHIDSIDGDDVMTKYEYPNGKKEQSLEPMKWIKSSIKNGVLKPIEETDSSSDGDYEHDVDTKSKTNYTYEQGLEAYSEGDKLKAKRLYKAALELGSWLGWTEKDLPPYENVVKGMKMNEADSNLDEELEKSVDTKGKYNVVLVNGERYNNVTFINTDSFKTEDGKTMLHQSIKSSKKIQESKRVIKEQEDMHLVIDRLNPKVVHKAVNHELAKLPFINADSYQKTLEKVVKKLQKDPRAYDDLYVANAKEINKHDEKLKMVPVKKEMKDPHGQMKSPKGVEKKPKANTKASKTENKKGKPKGVKEMPSKAKGHKGMEQMKHPEKKHKVMEAIESFLKKKLTEDTHHRFGIGQGVETPDGPGTVKAITGSTLTVEIGEGKMKDYQMNIISHHSGYKDEARDPLEDAKIKKYDPKAEPKKETVEEKKERVIKKVMEFLKKKKKPKNEVVTAKTSDTAHNQDVYNKLSKIPGQARVDMKKAYDAGKTIDI